MTNNTYIEISLKVGQNIKRQKTLESNEKVGIYIYI